jgi:Ca2+-binding EF-hand superfamily protein
MNKATIAAALLAVGLGVSSAPAFADPGAFEWLLEQTDLNRDGMVTKKEFLDVMGRMYDKSMNKMKGDPKMVKGDLMTMDGVKAMLAEIYKGA